MKTLRPWAVALCVFGLFLCGTVGTAHAEYLGDVCWSFSGDQGLAGTAQAGIYHIGGGHYLLAGVSIQTSPTYSKSPIYGNAEFIDGSYELTAVVADRSGSAATHVIYHIILNPMTLNGTFIGGGIQTTSTTAYFGYASGSATHIACP